MKHHFMHIFACLGLMTTASATVAAQDSTQWFSDATLRLDYIYAGTAHDQSIYLSNMKTYDGWYGKHMSMDKLPLQGNGTITVTDETGNDTLYIHSFSTLFQEWQSTEEATRVARSFENTLLIPMPKEKVQVTVELKNMHNGSKAFMKHTVDPHDRLIREHDSAETIPYTYLYRSGNSHDKVDVVFVPEGYTAEEMPIFRRDCEESIQAILNHQAFAARKDRFNFIALDAPSHHSGVSIPKYEKWKTTAVGSHFDTFYSERYLTTPHITRLYDLLDGIPCESIIILANTKEYGGGGIYNNYMLSAARGASNRSVIVHEFGHSFAGLADEYFYDDQYQTFYPAGIEPWEQNLTTLTDFDSKWKDMLPQGTAIPTPADGKNVYTQIGVYEGGGYQSKGVFRPAQDCRMKTNEAPDFCPVCTRAIKRVIDAISR